MHEVIIIKLYLSIRSLSVVSPSLDGDARTGGLAKLFLQEDAIQAYKHVKSTNRTLQQAQLVCNWP